VRCSQVNTRPNRFTAHEHFHLWLTSLRRGCQTTRHAHTHTRAWCAAVSWLGMDTALAQQCRVGGGGILSRLPLGLEILRDESAFKRGEKKARTVKQLPFLHARSNVLSSPSPQSRARDFHTLHGECAGVGGDGQQVSGEGVGSAHLRCAAYCMENGDCERTLGVHVSPGCLINRSNARFVYPQFLFSSYFYNPLIRKT
jgi:hypothetical protein